MTNNNTMTDLAQLISDNYKAISDNLPKSAQAAESVHQAFNALHGKHLEANSERLDQIALTLLIWSAHSAWIDAAIASASGHIPSAFANLRRSIELTCYAAKIKDSEQRASDWFNQRTDKEARQRFSGTCSIPLAYEKEKYRPLWAPIVAHDVCSYYGSHGDFEALALSLKDLTSKLVEKKLVYNYQANTKDSLSVFVYVILQGKRILTALMDTAENMIRDKKSFIPILEFVQSSVNEAVSELNKIEHPQWFKWVDLNEGTTEDRFKELIAEIKNMKQKRNTEEVGSLDNPPA